MLFRAAKPVSIFVCGAQKGGTSSLFAHFRDHPGLSHPRAKELHFFDDDCRDWANPDYRRLEAAFSRFDGDRPRYEMTPATSFWPDALERLARYNPQARLIFLRRDPLARAFRTGARNARAGRNRCPLPAPSARGANASCAAARTCAAIPMSNAGSMPIRQSARRPCSRANRFCSCGPKTLRKVTAPRLPGLPGSLALRPFPKARYEHRGTLVAQAPSAADRQWIARCLRDDLARLPALTGIDISAWPIMREWATAPCLAEVDG